MNTNILYDPDYKEKKDDKIYLIKYWNKFGEVEHMYVKADSTRSAINRFELIKKTKNWFSAGLAPIAD